VFICKELFHEMCYTLFPPPSLDKLLAHAYPP
jgi:hypothetical protein